MISVCDVFFDTGEVVSTVVPDPPFGFKDGNVPTLLHGLGRRPRESPFRLIPRSSKLTPRSSKLGEIRRSLVCDTTATSGKLLGPEEAGSSTL